MRLPPTWTKTSRRLGLSSSTGLLVIGVLYVAVITLWLVLEGTPSAPIGDPYLAAMEVLTILSALALVGFCVAMASLATGDERVFGLLALSSGILAAGLTTAVHFTQLTAVRQLWRSGAIADYRLIWPSSVFAVEYLAWDVLVGLTMLLSGASLGDDPARRGARGVLALGGSCCVAGVMGPLTGRMMLQNIAVFGYAVLLPLAAYLSLRVFRSVPPSAGSAG